MTTQRYRTACQEWWYLKKLVNYPEFVNRAYTRMLGREPARLMTLTASGSPERLAEIKAIVCSDERLQRIGPYIDGHQ